MDKHPFLQKKDHAFLQGEMIANHGDIILTTKKSTYPGPLGQFQPNLVH